eukprot:687843-Hanusia_phi.AAC.1
MEKLVTSTAPGALLSSWPSCGVPRLETALLRHWYIDSTSESCIRYLLKDDLVDLLVELESLVVHLVVQQHVRVQVVLGDVVQEVRNLVQVRPALARLLGAGESDEAKVRGGGKGGKEGEGKERN